NKIDVSDVDVSLNGIELIDREFVFSILERKVPNSSLEQCLPAMRIMHEIEHKMTK
ncbi:MAG: oxidoreductase, partial [Gammaproteobacteria bacterium]|nr:oxidoreductase [Gammaproteobacteria bacterium]